MSNNFHAQFVRKKWRSVQTLCNLSKEMCRITPKSVSTLTLTRMTKDEKDLTVFKGLMGWGFSWISFDVCSHEILLKKLKKWESMVQYST